MELFCFYKLALLQPEATGGDFGNEIMRFLRDNGLTIVLALIFAGTLGGMLLAGWYSHNQHLTDHGAETIDLLSYAFSGDFLSALFENWESEFLQMSAYVMLTVFLFQRGSSESKDPDKPNPEDEDPATKARNKTAPWPVRAGGLWRFVYSYSLGTALFLLFVASFLMHWTSSARAENEEALLHGGAPVQLWSYLFDAQLWFESFQNWQSEFLSTAVLIVLSIFLRHRGSPESKPVAAPYEKTGH
jgi:hypothetical protein